MIKLKSLQPVLRAFFVFIILAVQILPLLYSPAPVDAASWYNSSWTYRKSITISHASGALTNYQMPIRVYYGSGTDGTEVYDNWTASKVYTSSHCKTDFSDIRFTSDDGVTLLNYFSENKTTSSSAIFWVKMPSIGTGTTTFYMYYGNAAASATDNATLTFNKFDNFEWGSDGTNLNTSGGGVTWSVSTAGSSVAQIYATLPYSGTRCARQYRDGTNNVNVSTSLTNSDNQSIKFRLRTGASTYTAQFVHGTSSYQMNVRSVNNALYYWDGATEISLGITMTGSAGVDGPWYTIELKNASFAGAHTYDIYVNGTLVKSGAAMTTDASWANNAFYVAYYSGSGQFFYDDFMAVSWAVIPAAWGSWSSEESYSTSMNVSTLGSSSITTTTASVSGNITSSSHVVNKFGVLYGKVSVGATTWDNVTASISSFPYTYTDNLTGLTAATYYTYKAFSENTTLPLISYGSLAYFLTLPGAPSSLVASAGDTFVNCSWAAAAAGDNTTITTRVQYSVSGYPTSYTDGTTGIDWTASTSGQITSLTNGVTYYFSAFSKAVNGPYTQYSTAYAQATAMPVAVATVTTDNATSVEEDTATIGGNITDLRGAGNCTSRGVEYDTNSGTPYAHTSSESGSYGTGAFSFNVSSLTNGTLYYYRAFAVNTNGTGYGTEKTFLTKPLQSSDFTVTAASETSITITWTKGSGAQTTIIRGSQSGYPATPASDTAVYSSTGNSTTHSGLSTGQTWYYSAWSYVTEGGWVQYSDAASQGTATTFVAPTVTTKFSTGRGSVWAVVNGSVTSAGSPPAITVRGFDYGLTTGYGSSSTETDLAGFAIGNYSYVIAGLSPNTTYHYRAKAYNGTWAYGQDQTVSTLDALLNVASNNPLTTDNTSQIYANYYLAQTFTTDNITPLSITKVRVKLYKQAATVTAPVYIGIRTATSDNISNIDLATATITNNTILLASYNAVQEVTLSSPLSLEVNRKYAIVIYSPSSLTESSEYYYWRRVQAGSYTGGMAMSSSNSGLNWTGVTGDFWFEILGTETLQIQDAKIYKSYKEDDDWLVTCRYLNTVAPYYDTYDIKKYFALQFIDGNGNIKGQNILPGWGNKVGSIYQAAIPADNLTWGGSYRLRIQGLFSPYPYTEYVFQDIDWQGDDMALLDNWIITSGSIIGTYYNTVMTTYVSGKGEVLNATGGAILSNGISGLEIERSDIFQISTSSMTYAGNPTSQGFRQQKKSEFDTNWGTQGSAMWQNWEDLLGVDKEYFAAAAFFIAVLVLALVAFPAGHTTASLVLSFIFLGAGIGFGVDLIYLILIGLCAAFLLLKQFFMDK